MTKQQFNVNLDADLVRRVKHHAVDAQRSLGDLITDVLERHLAAQAGVRMQPMLHVEDMSAAVGFFEALGAQVSQGSRDGDFVLLQLGPTELSLLGHPPNPEQDEGALELNLVTEEDLSAVEERLRGAGVDIAAPASDEGFGAQLQLRTPDGLLVKVNRLEPDLYT